MKNKFRILIILLIFNSSFLFSQIKQEQKEYYNWFDEIVGIENTNLFIGLVYKEKHIKLKENSNFFLSPEFLFGYVNYDGELYFDLEMKYDVYEQEILVKLQNRKSGYTVIKLIKDKVKEFIIDNHKFLKLDARDIDETNIFGFHEVVLKNDFLTVFEKHKKNKEELFFEGIIYDNFRKVKSDIVILYKDEYYKIKSKKDLLNIFPEFKKEINNLFSKNRSIRNSNPDVFVLKTIEYLDTLILEK